MNTSAVVNGIRIRLRIVASPHFYTQRSVVLLLLHNFLRLIAFLKTARPNRGILVKTQRLKNTKIGKDALLIAGGPSVDLLDTQYVKEAGYDVFAMNGYNRFSISKTLVPDYYCLSDPLHFAPRSLEGVEEVKLLENYISSQNITLIAPHTALQSDFFSSCDKIYFDDRELTFFNKNIYPVSPRAYCSNTFYKLLAMACYLGYEKIFIIGLENSNFKNYVGNAKNQIVDLGEETAKRITTDVSALIEPAEIEFSSGMAGRMQSYSHLFGDLRLFKNHRIINLSENSLVDIFEKDGDSELLLGNYEKN
jgi:hypothetical protein